jgi:hypothetical protein
MTHLFSDFFPPEVLAFCADRSVDFMPDPMSGRLNQPQIDFLVDHLGPFVSYVVTIRQVHGNRIVVADRHTSPGLEADGVISRQKGIPLTVRTADCLPVFLFDRDSHAIGLVHAGWKGTREGVVIRAVEKMKEEFGTEPVNLKAAFGPAIGSCCYEVGKEFRDYFPEEVTEKEGKFFLDMPLINKRQLLASGVPGDHILVSNSCTACDLNYFSYRREGEKAGRMISVMMLK